MAASIRTYRTGDHLFHEGQPSDSLFIIQKGSVEIRKKKAGGFIPIAKVYSGEVLGELSFFDKKPRSASAVAMQDVEVVQVGFDAMEKILNKVPGYLKTIVVAMAERLRKANDSIRKLQKNVERDASDDNDAADMNTASVLEATDQKSVPLESDAIPEEGDPEKK
jgi:CRP/FNR family transcriptional regulator, cyclic AMP receptor protein